MEKRRVPAPMNKNWKRLFRVERGERVPIDCPRCAGLMIAERFEDHLDDTGQSHFFGLRCVLCGEIIDPQIMNHRSAGAPSHAR